MPLIELPRALDQYFAFAEIEPTRRGRRFSITLPFHDGDRIERLQWWYHVSPAQEQMFEGKGIAVYRERAIERFCKHIERWLEITRQRLHGDEPIPRIGPQATAPASSPAAQAADVPAEPLQQKRLAVGG